MKIKTAGNLCRFVFLISMIVLLTGCNNHRKSILQYTMNVNAPEFSTSINDDMKEIQSSSYNSREKILIRTNTTSDPYDIVLGNKKSKSKKNCSIMDRFDRKMLIAFERNNGNVRFGFDIDGINYKSIKIKNVMFTYKKRLNPSKTIKKSCRFNSGFQGLIGSVYNEAFLRKDNTVLKDIKHLRREIQHSIGLLMD